MPAPTRPVRIAIVVSRYNREVTDGLLLGARQTLAERGIGLKDEDVIDAPGAFEMPLIAQSLGETGLYDGVVCLGCVVKGDTAHFEFISLGAATGIMNASLSTRMPIAFGILTTYTDEQALIRARPGEANKGREAALACLASVETLRRLGVDNRPRAATLPLTVAPSRA